MSPIDAAAGDCILVRGLRLWAHVGVLAFEREQGQWFELDLELGVDLGPAARSDQLADTLDYSQLIAALQRQARAIRCLTLEHYSEQIFTLIAERWGGVPVQLELRKCAAPVPGFSGTVAVRRFRSAA
ncbi:MAG: dihydroneopterin aldolase [Cyanobium sp.]